MIEDGLIKDEQTLLLKFTQILGCYYYEISDVEGEEQKITFCDEYLCKGNLNVRLIKTLIEDCTGLQCIVEQDGRIYNICAHGYFNGEYNDNNLCDMDLESLYNYQYNKDLKLITDYVSNRSNLTCKQVSETLDININLIKKIVNNNPTLLKYFNAKCKQRIKKNK